MRADGFGRIADIATDLLDDDRVLDAVDDVGHRALSAYLSVVLGSWARGERLTLSQVARRSPAGWGLLDALAELLPALVAVGLLDDDGRIPAATWDSWYGPARDRYAQRVEASAKGVAARAAKRGQPNVVPPGLPDGQPLRSTLPSVRPSVPVPDGTDGLTSVAPAPVRAAPARRPPVPTEPDLDDDPYVGARFVPLVGETSTTTVYCLAYDAHRSEHRRAFVNGPFVCNVCGVRPPEGPSFAERMGANGFVRPAKGGA